MVHTTASYLVGRYTTENESLYYHPLGDRMFQPDLLATACSTMPRLMLLHLVLIAPNLRGSDIEPLFRQFDMAQAGIAACGQPTDSFSLAEQIREAGQRSNNVQLESRGLIRMALASKQPGDESAEEWKEFRDAAVALSGDQNLQWAQVEVRMISAYVEGLSSGSTMYAIEQLRRAIHSATKLDDQRLLGRGYFYLGRVLAKDGQYLMSAESLKHGLHLSHKSRDFVQEYVTLEQLLQDRTAAGVITEREVERFQQLVKRFGLPCSPSAFAVPGRIAAARTLHADLMHAASRKELTNWKDLDDLVTLSSFLAAQSAKLGEYDVAKSYLRDAQYVAILSRDKEIIGRLTWNRACILARMHEADEAMFAVEKQLAELGKQRAYDELFARGHQLASIFESTDQHAVATRCLKLVLSSAQSDMVASDRFAHHDVNTQAGAKSPESASRTADESLPPIASAAGNFAISKSYEDQGSAAAPVRPAASTIALALSVIFVVSFIVDRKHRRERQRLRSQLESRTSLIASVKSEAENSRSEAIRLATAKNDFACLLNHALREPLTSIVFNCELLRNHRSGDAEIARSAIQSSAQKVLQIIDSSLDFSQVESGKSPVIVKQFSPRLLLESVQRTVLPMVPDGVRLTVDVDADVPQTVLADETTLRQILLDLGLDAARRMDDGMIRFLCSVRPSAARNDVDLLLFIVDDTGRGQAKVASKEMQQQNGTDNFRAHNIGLHISSALVERFGGAVHFSSDPHNGTSHRIEVPIPPVATGQLRQRNRTKGSDNQVDYRVLVIDDDDSNLRVVGGLLKIIGCTGILASNWEQAEEQLLEGVDIVLMDLRMHCADGFELFDRIKQLSLEVMPAVVAMTGDVTNSAKRKTQDVGFHGFLAKPFTLAMLRDQINAAATPADSGVAGSAEGADRLADGAESLAESTANSAN